MVEKRKIIASVIVPEYLYYKATNPQKGAIDWARKEVSPLIHSDKCQILRTSTTHEERAMPFYNVNFMIECERFNSKAWKKVAYVTEG